MAVLRTVLLALLLVASACGTDGGGSGLGGTDDPTSTTATPTTTTTTTLTDDMAACSAAGMDTEPEEQPGLPAAVAETRREIVGAAVQCDFDRLEELALGGSASFSYSFGEDGDPAGYWRRQEGSDRPPQPLRFLVGLLGRPHRLLEPEHGGTAHYVWPSAFGYDSWDAVPEEDKEALKPLYTEEDFAGFEQFGGYIGYRVGITVEGDWIFFVAGD